MKFRIITVASVPSLVLNDCISGPNTLAMMRLSADGGGLLVHVVGQGEGRLLATGVGAILGSTVGDNVGTRFDAVTDNQNANNRNQPGINQICKPRQSRRLTYRAGIFSEREYHFFCNFT